MMPEDLPVTDDHTHIDIINGRGMEAAKDFKRAGGTHIFLVTLPTWTFGITPASGEDFRKIFDLNLKTAGMVKDEGICAFPIMGVHPAELTKLAGKISLSRAEEILKEGLDLAAEYVVDERAVALKSGRPHYPVPEDIWEASNRILEHALELAKDCDCALQIHAETGPCTDVCGTAKKMGIQPFRVVKHYATPDTPLTPSMIAKDENIGKLAAEKRLFTMESDHMDDPSRPGSVLGPKSVPRFTRRLLSSGAITEEDAFRIHKDTPEKVYGTDIVL
ncbi:TatD-related deoxyribonuclease [Methanomicrobium sp. W14]|uniref:TatD family hydrolase n=1 Tax=Methanomicrobium sp. W14 TaxID=2817839 RepID=UPI001AE672B3|nr:TatD family hydrolase [Methanomicrobium sp. W14]MBP2132242.1 TatD-related deoxyribonuclease [Methanomicrobium sp. W14]